MKPTKGEFITVHSEAIENSGTITDVEYYEGYITVTYIHDGMEYKAGTGGHLGDSWVDCYGNEAFVVIHGAFK